MRRPIPLQRTAQRGVVLFITLIVLVALALAALAMYRGSMGTTLVATNVVYKQAALNLADNGVQVATAAIFQRSTTGGTAVENDDGPNGYFAAVPTNDPNYADPSAWDWTGGDANAVVLTASQVCGSDATCIANSGGLTVYYKIHRMCNQTGAYNSATNVCALTIAQDPAATGSSLGVGATVFTGKPMLYYRITTRVDGPRNTRTITQTMVAVQT
jgi:type IV pilus assembly protein PilX